MVEAEPKPLAESHVSVNALFNELSAFCEFGEKTSCEDLLVGGSTIPLFINEFWTSRQRVANSLHEISYRACFKPQLPRFLLIV